MEDFAEFPSKGTLINRAHSHSISEKLKLLATEWPDDKPIEELVRDTAIATNRGLDKASEWIARLQAQDVMTVGDLRELHDEDWASL